MKTPTQTSVLPCTPDTFWRVFLDEAYVRSLYFDGLGFKGFEVLAMGESSRRLRIVPKLSLPAPLAKLLGETFAYEEHGELDRAKNRWSWRMVHPKGGGLGGIVATHGTVQIERDGDARCRRADEIAIEAKLFGLGGLIEASAEREARSAWAREHVFMSRWLESRAAPP
jgi:hypothetical protein